ncbi:hypothetical protein B0H13DRAFT_1891675 [Mycena leptocephala]|nr:hypothetical protein B0H13DRAFT_1891675 [Mycena leptocephala]
MSIFETAPKYSAPVQEHAALLKIADPMVTATRGPASRAEILPKGENGEFVGLKSLSSLTEESRRSGTANAARKLGIRHSKVTHLGPATIWPSDRALAAKRALNRPIQRSQTISPSNEAGQHAPGWMRSQSWTAAFFHLRTDHRQNSDPPGVQPNPSGIPNLVRS